MIFQVELGSLVLHHIERGLNVAYEGWAFYNDLAVFETYTARRQRIDNPNDTLEKPVILELAGELAHQRILDLGCGDAAFGRHALTNGCQAYLGIEGSQNMVKSAENYFVSLRRAGFLVESLREAEPQRERFEDENTYRRRKRIPLFLIMAGQKSPTQQRS